MRKRIHARPAKRSRKAAARAFWEHLESRILLSAGEWLVKFNGVPGNTRDVQVAYLEALFHDAGLDSKGINVHEHVGVDGVIIVTADPWVDLHAITNDLQPVPGFVSVEDWDDDASAAERSIYVPTSPGSEDEGGEEEEDPFAGASDLLSPDLGNGGLIYPALVQSPLGFNGINDTQTAQLSPPDSDGAVGPSSYIEAVNTALAIYNKSTGLPIAGGGITQFSTFFSSLGGVLSFSDPI